MWDSVAQNITSNPVIMIISLIVLSIIGFLALLFIIGLLVLTGKINIPKFKKHKLGIHDGCINDSDRKKENQESFLRGKTFLEFNVQRIKQSMEESEQVFDGISTKMVRLFYHIVAEVTGTKDGSTKHDESIFYKRQVDDCLSKECKREFRHRVRENHFPDMTPGEFELYINENVNEQIQIITEYLDLYYRPIIISREALYEKNQSIQSEIKADLNKLFYRCRTISSEYRDRALTILKAQGITDEETIRKEINWI